MNLPDLPVSHVLAQLLETLRSDGNAVLVAPPGAGKTTLVPLALLDACWCKNQKILVLEPRRIAARAAARRMAWLLGENVGETVGYRIRMDTKTSCKTRVEMVTGGVLTRMIQDDPELSGIGAILFDEFHERSMDGDLALALAIDVKQALREDLRLLVMSATLNGAAVADLLNCQVIESAGRAFPVTVRYHERRSDIRLEKFMADEIHHTLAGEKGSLLAFLPGQREIEQVAENLGKKTPDDVDIMPLFGAMDGAAQDRAIRPSAKGRRKVVLATSIAETSLTIDGVTVVIDSGLARLPRFEPANGLTRLETVRASRASIDQRAGRAGRTAPGLAIRLWREQQTAALPAHTPPEILAADLSHLALDLAAWGVDDATRLRWLDPPPMAAYQEAKKLLRALAAIDGAGSLTSHGRVLRALGQPPRIGHMVLEAAKTGCLQKAAFLSVVASERGLGGNDIDLELRCERAQAEKGQRASGARSLARRLVQTTQNLLPVTKSGHSGICSIGAILSLAWPERIARRTGQSQSGAIRYLLANGSGAEIAAEHALARHPWIVVADISGKAGAARILSAAPVDQKEIEKLHKSKITERDVVKFNPDNGRVKANRVRMMGALKLSERPTDDPDQTLIERALTDAIRQFGVSLLPWNDAANSLRNRLLFLHAHDPQSWPDVSDQALQNRLDDWFAALVAGKSGLDALSANMLDNGLKMLVTWDKQTLIDRLAPKTLELENGKQLTLHYQDGDVVVSARAQVFFGVNRHPSIMAGMAPVLVELLSPAARPVQKTRDLPGFWRGSWSDVRADMRSRYPKHYWPENPVENPVDGRPKTGRRRK